MRSKPTDDGTSGRRIYMAANDPANAIITPASASPPYTFRSYYTPLFYNCNCNGLSISKCDQTGSLSRDLRGTSSSRPSHPQTHGDSSLVLGSRRARSPLHRFRTTEKSDAVPHARPLPHWQGCSASTSCLSTIFEIHLTDAYTRCCCRASRITRIADKLRSPT